MLIALSLTAFLSLAAFQLITNTINSQQFSKRSFSEQARLFQVESIIFQDFIHIVNRPIRDSIGNQEAAYLTNKSNFEILFTRGGMPIIADKSTSLQRVAYGLDGDILVRWYWQHLDRPLGEEPVRQELLTGVVGFSVEQLDKNSSRYTSRWNVTKKQLLPAMMKVSIKLANGQKSEQIIPGIEIL